LCIRNLGPVAFNLSVILYPVWPYSARRFGVGGNEREEDFGGEVRTQGRAIA
jgi:hypothetical protein